MTKIIKPQFFKNNTQRRKRGRPKNVNGRNTSSHENNKFITRSVETQGGMAFGFRKTARQLL
jgi:hypothetical protein